MTRFGKSCRNARLEFFPCFRESTSMKERFGSSESNSRILAVQCQAGIEYPQRLIDPSLITQYNGQPEHSGIASHCRGGSKQMLRLDKIARPMGGGSFAEYLLDTHGIKHTRRLNR